MSRYSLNPDRLFDRPWRPGHPFHPKTGRLRRLAMIVLLVVFVATIIGYRYITDAKRVRAMAESYLSELVGGQVQVENATLSIFEGLRLDGVRVYVDRDPGKGNWKRPADSLVFTARTFTVQYEPRSMLRGQLEAKQIVAEKPQVHFARNVETNHWNFERLAQNREPPPPEPTAPKQAPAAPPPLPMLMLRNARVQISELENGRNNTLGYISIDGQLTPRASKRGGYQDLYDFVLQSRGLSDAMGPLIDGSIEIGTGRLIAHLKQFEFSRDVRAMLPDNVGRLLERYELNGRIDVPLMDYMPAHGDKPASFQLQMKLDGVSFSVAPDQLLSPEELQRDDSLRQSARLLQNVYGAAGFAPAAGSSTARGPIAAAPNPVDSLSRLLRAEPLKFSSVNGVFDFTDDRVTLRDVSGRIEGNLFTLDGHIDGYEPDSPLAIRIASPKSEQVEIPSNPAYVWSLPGGVREIYNSFRPQGSCRLQFDLKRAPESKAVQIAGFVDLIDARFLFEDFPYPVRHTAGRIEIARDPKTQLDWLMLKGIAGQGYIDGPNRDRTIRLDGFIGPLNVPHEDPGGLVHIRGQEIASEPALLSAFDADVRSALSVFDADNTGLFPTFFGDLSCEVYKTFGDVGNFKVRVDLDVKRANGMLKGFRYPLRNISANVKIRDGYADIANVKVPHGDADISVSGRVVWDKPEQRKLPPEGPQRTELKLQVRGLDIDEDLLSALPQDAAGWIRRSNVKGKIDVNGQITGGDNRSAGVSPASAQAGETPALRDTADDLPLDLALAITLRDATVRPENGKYEITGVGGRMALLPGRLDVLELRGTHGKSTVRAAGQVRWEGDKTQQAMVVSADNIVLEPDLYALLPAEAQEAWNEIRPKGTLDAEITFASISADPADSRTATHRATPGVAIIDLSQKPPATQPAIALDLPASAGNAAVHRQLPHGLHGTLRPRELSVDLRSTPLLLEKVGGEVGLSPERIDLRKLTASHGKAELAVSGTGTLGERTQWDLQISAKNLAIDNDLRKALPEGIGELLQSTGAAGTLDVNLERFTYRSGAIETTSARPATSPTRGAPELDLAGKLTLKDVTLDVGVPMQKVNGGITLDGSFRNDRIHIMSGRLDIASLEMAGREVTNLRADLHRGVDQPALTLKNMQAVVAGGDVAGDVVLLYPEQGPPRYGLSLFLRNADVRELAKETTEKVNGRLTASLTLEGTSGKLSSRRGRGDVVVTGKEMYRIPVVLGLMQVTNLGLPVNSPFSNATARYSVDGERVTFERIELRNNNMLMAGDGFMDFGSKQVRMIFVTDNPGAFKIPFLGDIWRGAQHELLRIHVHGTVQDPKVENRPLGTFTTTVDEVFRGDSPKTKPKK